MNCSAIPKKHEHVCSICRETVDINTRDCTLLPCFHPYHSSCIGTLFRQGSSCCPVCKTPVLHETSRDGLLIILDDFSEHLLSNQNADNADDDEKNMEHSPLFVPSVVPQITPSVVPQITPSVVPHAPQADDEKNDEYVGISESSAREIHDAIAEVNSTSVANRLTESILALVNTEIADLVSSHVAGSRIRKANTNMINGVILSRLQNLENVIRLMFININGIATLFKPEVIEKMSIDIAQAVRASAVL